MFYTAFGKKTTKLFEDNYVYKKKLVVEVPTPNSTKWISTGELNNREVTGNLVATYRDKSGIVLDKLQFRSDGRLSADAHLEVDKSIKLLVSTEDGKINNHLHHSHSSNGGDPTNSHYVRGGNTNKSTGKIGIEYANPTLFSSKLEVDVVNGPTVYSSSMIKLRKDLYLGGEIKYNFLNEDKASKHDKLEESNVGIGYFTKNTDMSLYTTERATLANFALYTTISPSLAFGALCVSHLHQNSSSLANSNQLYKYNSITIGCKYLVDDFTQFGVKIDTKAMLGISFLQRLNKVAKLNIATEIDCKDLGSDSHKFGLGVILGF